ncbi:hypothetical protein L4P27_006097 [Pseudomonas aeruginosa]|nr:hypothetical protein [Pseudomonas aeruginosa]EKV3012271.1 hypothetical protein [Pseudomonas aeruginosa]
MQITPHLLTAEEFAAIAVAHPLTNHGRRWQVCYGPAGYHAFSDELTAEEAIADVHEALVNNAIYRHIFCSEGIFDTTPELPPANVLAQYPQVVSRFPELGVRASLQGTLSF